MNTKVVLKRVAFLGMLFAGGTGYAQSNRGKEHTQTTGVTDAGGEALLARLVELQNYTLGAVEQARANVELMAAGGGRLPVPGTVRPGSPAAAYLLAFQEH